MAIFKFALDDQRLNDGVIINTHHSFLNLSILQERMILFPLKNQFPFDTSAIFSRNAWHKWEQLSFLAFPTIQCSIVFK